MRRFVVWHPFRFPFSYPFPLSGRVGPARPGFAPEKAKRMPEATVRRPRRAPTSGLPFRTVRPSLLDHRFRGDPWIVAGPDGTFALCLGSYRLLMLDVVRLDLPALNHLLERVRAAAPRGAIL
jgi:hypothetical protein